MVDSLARNNQIPNDIVWPPADDACWVQMSLSNIIITEPQARVRDTQMGDQAPEGNGTQISKS